MPISSAGAAFDKPLSFSKQIWFVRPKRRAKSVRAFNQQYCLADLALLELAHRQNCKSRQRVTARIRLYERLTAFDKLIESQVGKRNRKLIPALLIVRVRSHRSCTLRSVERELKLVARSA